MAVFKHLKYFPLLLIVSAHVFGQQAGGLLWSVVKPGSRDTAYLLGTLHKYPRTVVALPDVVQDKLQQCKTLYTEIQSDWKMALKKLSSGKFTNQLIYESPEWPEEKWNAIEEWFVEVQHMEKRDFDYLKKRNSLSIISPMYFKLFGFENGSIEGDLKSMAKQKGIPIKGLDKDWYEIQSWYAHYGQQSEGFWESGNLDSLLAVGYYGLADLIIAYAIQDTTALNKRSSKHDEIWADGLTLVEWRNVNWMKKLPQLMQSKTFVAVGAAHLFGEFGVVNLLRKSGFDCQPVQGHFGGEKLERFIRRNSKQYQVYTIQKK